ncbi:hypothetical protein ABW19_dt0207348 [Dactylella cylindrospora]|nr:hypothetical protein ABW19_dt0207348 [Dactylella cylindrospora]
MDLRWEQTTITLSGNPSQLSSMEADISSSIDNIVDWVNATTGGWDSQNGATETCCGTSILLDDEVTIDYGGWCPTTVLTGYNTVLPQSIAWQFVNGSLADCGYNLGGGIPTTKTAVYVAKVTEDTSSSQSTTPKTSPSSRMPTSTPPPNQPTTTSRTTPRNQNPPATREPQESPSPRPPTRNPQSPTTVPKDDSQGTSKAPAPIPQGTPASSDTPDAPEGTPVPDTIPGASAILRLIGPPAPEPSLSVIVTSLPIFITSTDAAGNPTVITSFTEIPIATAINILTSDSAGNVITTRETAFNPTATVIAEDPGSGGSEGGPTGPNQSQALDAEQSQQPNTGFQIEPSLTTITTATSRRGPSQTSGSQFSISSGDGQATEVLSTTDQNGLPSSTEENGAGNTESSSESSIPATIPFVTIFLVFISATAIVS